MSTQMNHFAVLEPQVQNGSLGLNQGAGRDAFLLESPGSSIFWCLFQLPEAAEAGTQAEEVCVSRCTTGGG